LHRYWPACRSRRNFGQSVKTLIETANVHHARWVMFTETCYHFPQSAYTQTCSVLIVETEHRYEYSTAIVRHPSTDDSPKPMVDRSYTSRPPRWRAYPQRREEAGPLERTYLLLARVPMAGAARLSIGRQLRHERVAAAVPGGVEGARGCGVVGGLGESRHVGPSASVHRDVPASIETRSPEEGGVVEPRVDHQRVARVVCSHSKPIVTIPLQLCSGSPPVRACLRSAGS
jgi:hypothetical protein